MNSQVILIDDNSEDNVTHEALIRDWNNDLDISIIDNSEEALQYLKREFSEKNYVSKKTTVFLGEITPYPEVVELAEYIDRMRIDDNENIEVYFLTSKKAEVLRAKIALKPLVTKVIHKPLTAASLAQIFA